MNNKILAVAVVAILGVAGVGAYIYLSSGDEYDLTIACGTKNCYEPFWIADKYGYFEDEGVKVKMLYVDGGGSALTALLSEKADMTLVGADPAIRLFDQTDDGMAIATVEVAVGGPQAIDFAVREDAGIDLEDPAATFFNGNGSIKVRCGLDISTGYYSGYLSYLYSAFEDGKLTEAQYALLKTVKTNSTDGGIVNISFDHQVLAIENNTVQMLCSGNAAVLASQLPGVTSMSSPYESVVSMCIIIASGNAIENKSDALTKALRALDSACAFIQSPDTKQEAAEYCAAFYGATGWTAVSQMNFFNANYWDICHMNGLEDTLKFKAGLLGYQDFDCSDRILFNYLDAIHPEGESYWYDPIQETMVDPPA